MSRDYDAQLLESVAVRRRRLMSALMWGPLRDRREFTDGLSRVAASFMIAAAICAGTVAWSFLHHALAGQHTLTSVPSVPNPGRS